jgi:hypothetical protein
MKIRALWDGKVVGSIEYSTPIYITNTNQVLLSFIDRFPQKLSIHPYWIDENDNPLGYICYDLLYEAERIEMFLMVPPEFQGKIVGWKDIDNKKTIIELKGEYI